VDGGSEAALLAREAGCCVGFPFNHPAAARPIRSPTGNIITGHPVWSPEVFSPLIALGPTNQVTVTDRESHSVTIEASREGLRRPGQLTPPLGWCTGHGGLEPLPAVGATVTGYLTDPARASAEMGTMTVAHQLQKQPDSTRNARVLAVWEGIRRTHGAAGSRLPC
jgi:hypothetical protein